MKNYEALLNLFSEHLEKYRSQLSAKQPKELYEPENYILSLGGKRLRPLLCLIACDLFDKDPKRALDSALSVELFHNFTLIHDDILDNAPMRRNQPTVHTKWNINIGILSGDVMMAKAYDILNRYNATQLKSLLNIMLATSIEVCEGQQMDMNFEKSKSVTVSEYKQMITFKTAVLLGCSLKMGAINADASEEDAEHLFEFGKHLGIAFQLNDDMLDAYSANEKFGKQVGGDILANKKTFLIVKAFELANASQKQKLESYLNLTSMKGLEKISGTLELFKELNIKTLAQNEADSHTKEAISHLKLVNANHHKIKQLEELATTLLTRDI